MRRVLLAAFILTLLLTVAFGAAAQDDTDPADLPTLRIAVLPVLNTLPLYVAEAENFYVEEGVNVELIPFNAARDQQVALQAGEVDGANTDLAVLALLVSGGVDLRAVRLEPIEGRYFSIVAGADSGIETLDDLRGVPIAISQNTIIEYLTTEILRDAGFSDDEIVYEEVPQIPVRLELINTGQVAAGTLPEPLTTLAVELQGATLVGSDEVAAFVPTVLAFSTEVLTGQPEAIFAFLRAYERAVIALDENPEAYRDVMNANNRIPEPLHGNYPVPSFPRTVVPSPEQTALVVDWMVDIGLLQEPLAYDELITADFLPVGSLYQVIAGTESLSTLTTAIQWAGLASILHENEGPLTILAPTDEAFEAALEALDITLDDLLADIDALVDILTYHVIATDLPAEVILSLEGIDMPTLQGSEVSITIDGDNVIINGSANVIDADVPAANGLLHIIDSVLLPPSE